MTEIIAVIGELFTAVMGWAGEVGEVIAETPLLLLGVAVPLVGLGVGLFKRLLRG